MYTFNFPDKINEPQYNFLQKLAISQNLKMMDLDTLQSLKWHWQNSLQSWNEVSLGRNHVTFIARGFPTHCSMGKIIGHLYQLITNFVSICTMSERSLTISSILTSFSNMLVFLIRIKFEFLKSY